MHTDSWRQSRGFRILYDGTVSGKPGSWLDLYLYHPAENLNLGQIKLISRFSDTAAPLKMAPPIAFYSYFGSK